MWTDYDRWHPRTNKEKEIAIGVAYITLYGRKQCPALTKMISLSSFKEHVKPEIDPDCDWFKWEMIATSLIIFSEIELSKLFMWHSFYLFTITVHIYTREPIVSWNILYFINCPIHHNVLQCEPKYMHYHNNNIDINKCEFKKVSPSPWELGYGVAATHGGTYSRV